MTKGLTYFLLTALSLTACARVDVFKQVEEQAEVRFSTYATRRTGTKAGSSFIGSGETFAEGDTIVVFGFYHPGSGSTDGSWAGDASNKPDFMYDQNVIKQADGSWAYSPIKYWPNSYRDGSDYIDKLSFWAYYPEHAVGKGLSLYASGTTTAYSNTTSGLPKLVFTQQEDPDNMIDLLIASPVKDIYKTQTHEVSDQTWTYGALTNGAVNLVFSHALALVDFELSEGTGATIHELSLTNLYKTGTLADAGVLTWSNVTDLYDLEQDDDREVVGTNILRLLLIPQTIHSDATISMTFDIHFESSDNTGDIVYSGESAEAKLFRNEGDANDYGVTAWLPGKHYIYRVSAGLDRIEFEEVVEGTEDWNSFGDPIQVSN
ncbi:MAG: fimbrillin family protein [Bacteroidales bacterium]|nr:fimbrillin family protein [Bacteroidales bacterium]